MININLLPKHLRRVREPGYWRLVAVLFPLVVLGALGFIQFSVVQTINNLESDIVTLEAKKQSLQPFIQRQLELQARLEQVNDLLAIRDQVRENRIIWTGEIDALLSTLPTQGDASRPRIDFQSLTMAAVNPPQADENRFEGAPIVAEMNVTGKVINTQVLSDFIRSLESSNDFGVAFQNASRDSNSGIYDYTLTIGALAGGGVGGDSESQ